VSTREGSGRTVDEAIEQALAQMGVARDEVDVEILQEPRPALLGLGGREARVRVVRRPTAADVANVFVTDALQMMGYTVTANVSELEDGLVMTLEGPGVPRLVGRHGRTLDALEVLLIPHLARRLGKRIPVTLDAAGYRAKREQALTDLARAAAERAVAAHTAVALDPMHPRDRRVVHLALKDDPLVRTASEGEGDHRHVVVVPRGEE
jgi:spoIIIJ-associated protein